MNVTKAGAVVVVLLAATSPVRADGKTKAAQEVAEMVLQKFGRAAVQDGTEALARKIERAAALHGQDVFAAVKRVGPRGLALIEEGGARSGQVAKVLATHGEEGMVFVANRPQALQLLETHGEEAAAALVKSRGVAEPAIKEFGRPAIGAFQALENPQNARRLAMLAENGELSMAGKSGEILRVLEQYGDPACEFLYRHKAILASGVALTAFLANPEPFISGAKDIAEVMAVNAVKPLAEVPGVAVKEVAKQTHWTLVILIGMAATTLMVGARMRPMLLRWRTGS